MSLWGRDPRTAKPLYGQDDPAAGSETIIGFPGCQMQAEDPPTRAELNDQMREDLNLRGQLGRLPPGDQAPRETTFVIKETFPGHAPVEIEGEEKPTIYRGAEANRRRGAESIPTVCPNGCGPQGEGWFVSARGVRCSVCGFFRERP